MDEQEKQIVPPSHNESDIMWNNVFADIRKQKRDKKRRKMLLFSSISVAAIIIIFGSIVTYKTLRSPEIYYAYDKNITVTLADLSQVTLLKGAKLTVEKSFPNETRDVFLEGNAVFNVTKSKAHPFIVHANGYETKVLGTVFKIIQTSKAFNVDLYEGKVQITTTGKLRESYVIHPKETFSNMGLPNVATIAPTDRPKTASDNIAISTLSFNDIRLEDAVSVLEETYEIEIKFPTEMRTSTISISNGKGSASDIIRLISLQLNLKTKKINDKIFELEE